MGKVHEPQGKVIEGDYEGKNVYKFSDGDRFVIVTGKIDTRLYGQSHTIEKDIDKNN